MADTAPLFSARSPHYDRMAPMWRYVRDVYTGDYLPTPTSSTGLPVSGARYTPSAGSGNRDGENLYVTRRSQAESQGEYAERLRVLDPDMLFSRAVSSLTGQIAAAESQISRTWTAEDGKAFGSVEEEDTDADRLWKDANGEGVEWPVFWRQGAADLILYQEVWFLVSGATKEDVPAGVSDTGALLTLPVDRDPRVQMVEPGAVVYVLESAGRPVQVHVLTTRAADALAGREKAQEVLTIYRLNGWERRVREEGAADDGAVEDSGPYEYYEDREKTRRCLPIYRGCLPLRQYVAYILARKAVARLNMENRRDSLVNKANTPRLVLKAENNDTAKGAVEELVQGQSFHRVGKDDALDFIEPGTSGADLATRVLGDKEQAFQSAAFQTYEDQARQVTATEVRQQSRGGADAFLTLLTGALDGAENRALWLLAQAFGLPPDEWAVARVQRSTKFVAFDEAEQADKLADALFGERPVPADAATRLAVLRRYFDVHSVTYDEKLLETAVNAWVSPAALSALTGAGISLTAALEAQGLSPEQARKLSQVSTGVEP